jgi:hypothetical protein
MDFKISIETAGKRYIMQVDRFYIGDSLDKYKVSAGERSIELQSNIPEIQRTGARKRIAWKVLKADFKDNVNEDDRALLIQRIFRSIELEIFPNKRPSFIPNKKDDKPQL